MIRQRCAIYTSKSTEDGPKQDFNSLDAQREACAALIHSQKHEGWTELSERYDDGGFSGGSMDRPGLEQLLEDVRAGRIDVIVVYKVDRLTRSLADFAKMVDVFDRAGVPFGSVTHAFKMTSSLGRLTLNVLRSVARFEREVTAVRVRDKVAASKRKGMWMGGAVPLGYDVQDKSLVVNPGEATALRTIFAEYQATGTVRRLSAKLNELGVASKRRTDRLGRTSGARAFPRGALYNILRNPIYVGKIRHKHALHEGPHEAIIDDATWQLVQAQLVDHGGSKVERPRRPAKRLLDGLLSDSKGQAMRTTNTSKSQRRNGTTQTIRYWYYTSKASGAEDRICVERLPTKEVERLVLRSLKDRLSDVTWLADQAGPAEEVGTLIADILQAARSWSEEIGGLPGDTMAQSLRGVIGRIDAKKGRLRIQVKLHALMGPDESCVPTIAAFDVPFQKRQNGRAKPIIIAPTDAPRPDSELIALVADAGRWADELRAGKSATIRQIDERESLRSGTASRILPLAWLAPEISTAILDGRQPPHFSAKSLRSLPELPLDWEERRQILGFPHL